MRLLVKKLDKCSVVISKYTFLLLFRHDVENICYIVYMFIICCNVSHQHHLSIKENAMNANTIYRETCLTSIQFNSVREISLKACLYQFLHTRKSVLQSYPREKSSLVKVVQSTLFLHVQQNYDKSISPLS